VAPLITIGITSYREGDWLRACWSSVVGQTDERWRAVLVLDGGADAATRAVFDSLDDPRLSKHALADNGGPYPARNRAFALTETPYHFYLDGDDQLLPDSVAIVLEQFAAHPEASFVYGDYQLFGARDEVQRWNPAPTWDDFVPSQPIPGPCAYKRALWEELGGYPQELARGNGDYDLLIGALERGHTGRHAGRIFYRHRVGHGRRVSGSYERRYWETAETIVRRHPVFFADRQRALGFLAVGYRRSLEAELADGHPLRAAALARRGVERGLWRDRASAGEVLSAAVRGAARMGRDRLDRIRTSIQRP